MNGRASKIGNDVFFVCSLIDYIARKTKNKRKLVVKMLGRANISKIYELSDVYHSDNIDKVSADFIKDCNIPEGNFDNVSACKYTVPSHFDIGKVYKRLVFDVAEYKKISFVDAILDVYNSFVSGKIDDYNSSFYYDAPQNIFNAYVLGYLE